MSVVVCFYLWREHLDKVLPDGYTWFVYCVSIHGSLYMFYHIRPQ